jgi:tetraacyldisaccharide 4'-kinase
MNAVEYLYYLGYLVDKHLGLKKQKRLPARVISAGNITVGGTGKTPATIALAKEARRRGYLPVILTRGYGGRAKGPCFVDRMAWEEYGDEPVLISEKLSDVPVVKGSDRYAAGMFALRNLASRVSSHNPDILFILDDGFQHYQLFRDRDILLIDGTNPFGNHKLLPFGPLREPLDAMARADIIVIKKSGISAVNPSLSIKREEADFHNEKMRSLVTEIRGYHPSSPVFFAEHRPSGFARVQGSGFPLEWAKGKRFFGFCGIGNPQSFMETLSTLGMELKGFREFRDHYRYRQADINAIFQDAEKCEAGWIVTTEKDIIKLAVLKIPANLVALAVEFIPDEALFEQVFNF